MHILMAVTEDRAISESLRAALPPSDLLLIEGSIEEAQRRLITLQPDAILIDDSNRLGMAALKALHQMAPDTPLIMLTARSDRENLAAYALNGARASIAKPFQCEDLLRAVEGSVTRGATRVPAEQRPLSIGVPANAAQHQMALRWMSRNLSQMDDPARLAQGLVDAVVDIFDAVRASVFLHGNGSVRHAASHGMANQVVGSLQLSYTRGLMRWLEENACLFDRQMQPHAQEAMKELQVLGGRVAAPLITGGRVCGVLVAGEKSSGLDYTRDELDLLGVMARCVSSCLDKSKQYRDISRQQSRLDAVLSNITAGVVTVRPDRTISMMNESAERLLRIRAVDVLGRSVQKLGSAFADVVLRTLADGKPRLRQEIRDAAIKKRLGLSVTPLGAEGAVVIFSAIPDGAPGANADEDVAYSRIWDYLASRLAQEIKNPMVAISTYAQLLPKKYDSDEFREEFSGVVLGEVDRINRVVEVLYEFAGQPRLSLMESDLNDSAREVLKQFEAELRDRSIKVETDFAQDAHVLLDRSQFSRALSNLIRNSVEAMESGGTLRLQTRRENGHMDLVVHDSGPGVAAQDAGLIFQPFFSTKERGLGLGLTMAARIAEQHHATLELLQSEAAGGAFAFHFPVTAIPSRAPDGEAAEKPKTTSTRGANGAR